MKRNTLVVSCSPRAEKSSSNSIAEYLIEQFELSGISTHKVVLCREISDENRIVDMMDKADVIMLTLPIYENSVPGLVVQFFELVYQYRNELSNRKRQMFAITNSGFADVAANQSAIEVCRLFAEEMGFDWLGGVAVAPGTLMTGNSLSASKRTYKKLMQSLDKVADSISKNGNVTAEAFELLSKPFISPYIYMIVGYILQRKVMGKIGKSAYFARPLTDY